MDREKEIFFDGVVANWLVQSKISDARRQVDDAIWKVEGILNQLSRLQGIAGCRRPADRPDTGEKYGVSHEMHCVGKRCLWYSIFEVDHELFGYYECEKGVAFAEKTQAESPVVARWNEYMADVLELEMDPVTGAQPKLEQVFRLD